MTFNTFFMKAFLFSFLLLSSLLASAQVQVDSLCHRQIGIRLLGAEPIMTVEFVDPETRETKMLIDHDGHILVVRNMKHMKEVLAPYGYVKTGITVYSFFQDDEKTDAAENIAYHVFVISW